MIHTDTVSKPQLREKIETLIEEYKDSVSSYEGDDTTDAELARAADLGAIEGLTAALKMLDH
jgi:hypothetical protein